MDRLSSDARLGRFASASRPYKRFTDERIGGARRRGLQEKVCANILLRQAEIPVSVRAVLVFSRTFAV